MQVSFVAFICSGTLKHTYLHNVSTTKRSICTYKRYTFDKWEYQRCTSIFVFIYAAPSDSPLPSTTKVISFGLAFEIQIPYVQKYLNIHLSKYVLRTIFIILVYQGAAGADVVVCILRIKLSMRMMVGIVLDIFGCVQILVVKYG